MMAPDPPFGPRTPFEPIVPDEPCAAAFESDCDFDGVFSLPGANLRGDGATAADAGVG